MKGWRANLLLVLIFITAAIIIGRLFYVQVLNYKFYSALSLGQQSVFKEVKGERGEIFLENNQSKSEINPQKSLAINKENWVVAVLPKEVDEKESFSKVLGETIGVEESAILSKLNSSESYVVIKKDLSQKDVESIKKLKLKGIDFENVPARFYPQETMAAQLIGFLGGEEMGQYGIEGYYEGLLKGKDGVQEQKNGFGVISAGVSDNIKGSDLILTVDYNIQFQAESLLAQAKKDLNIDSGQIIVIKPDSGRILALANYPLFNPNNYSKEENLDVFQNGATQKVFEPGSIFKPFTMAMALQEHKVSTDSTFTDTGSAKIGPDTVYNFDKKIYGKQTMSGILEKSINTGAVYLSSLLNHSTFFDYVDKFGFTDKTGVDLQGEVYSRNESLRKGSGFGYATASFGQGIEVTPIQLVRAFSIFANDGKMPKPYIVEKIVHGQDELVTKPEVSEQLISSKTASDVRNMLTQVVERGFGDIAKIDGYYLAGKTGTAEVPFEDRKGYYSDRTIQSFIGFGPALKPQFLILVKLDHPNVPKSALSAAPIFKKLTQYIINYWQIPPDY